MKQKVEENGFLPRCNELCIVSEWKPVVSIFSLYFFREERQVKKKFKPPVESFVQRRRNLYLGTILDEEKLFRVFENLEVLLNLGENMLIGLIRVNFMIWDFVFLIILLDLYVILAVKNTK